MHDQAEDYRQKAEKAGHRMTNKGKSDDERMQDLPQTGLLRIKQVLQFVPVSRSGWWKGVKEGRYPQPVKLSERVTCWGVADIRRLVEGAQS